MNLLNDLLQWSVACLLIPIELYSSLSAPLACWQLWTCSGGLSNITHQILLSIIDRATWDWLDNRMTVLLDHARCLDEAPLDQLRWPWWSQLIKDSFMQEHALISSTEFTTYTLIAAMHAPRVLETMKLPCKAPRKAMPTVQQNCLVMTNRAMHRKHGLMENPRGCFATMCIRSAQPSIEPESKASADLLNSL